MHARLSTSFCPCAMTPLIHWPCRTPVGEFDAFNTIMAILRMRKKFPDAKPQQYFELDQQFRDFVDCKPCECEPHLTRMGVEGMWEILSSGDGACGVDLERAHEASATTWTCALPGALHWM